MRTLLIFLSIALFFTLVQYSNGAPTADISSESEDNSFETREMNNLKPISDTDDESDQSSEEKQEFNEALKLIQNIGKPRSQNVDQDDSDDLFNVESIVNNDHRRILNDNDEDEE